MPSPRTNFSEWVTSTGNALGYTNSASLARALGIQQSTVSRWKTKNSQPSVEHLSRISQLFGVDLKVLLVLAGYLEAPPPSPKELRSATGRTRAEKIIEDAPIDESEKDALRRFWLRRIGEEEARLERAVEFVVEASYTGFTRDAIEDELEAQSKTSIARHFNELIYAMSETLVPGVMPEEAGGEVDLDHGGWHRPTKDVGTPMPRVIAIQVARVGNLHEMEPAEGKWRVVLLKESGLPAAWTPPLELEEANLIAQNWKRENWPHITDID